jgi:hypothetical protein
MPSIREQLNSIREDKANEQDQQQGAAPNDQMQAQDAEKFNDDKSIPKEDGMSL